MLFHSNCKPSKYPDIINNETFSANRDSIEDSKIQFRCSHQMLQQYLNEIREINDIDFLNRALKFAFLPITNMYIYKKDTMIKYRKITYDFNDY